ncbi:20S proteasome subunit beta type 6 [Guillardia theta CCMP2712]|uniref:Proteasome subunit beta n=3 Tax=Guillardia theta TaxID=55529 RepID=L1IT96_GUITC|nr:20S proteasome subunit beta type 6 [Guillardia theta CCMP2712]EKX39065.1 20S proteasome subunit beta type 6 [Guillardia theta CCMP2712]|mmetsp:Transcript_22229/g.73146  ORF Transcript_22229/g.73146 Transcript_22229/m.73146 type:complete len:222 (+) Transcript_22229:531-1196(+)|eukprot:XP_005826045.1 20S proteasome subunit beta type 6 [Guillardia theta CCMP2712]
MPSYMPGPGVDVSDPALGTTIMAVEFDGGVVLGADSRTSSGSYVANRVSDKITYVSDKIYVCRSGSAADTQAVADMMRMYLGMHSLEIGKDPEVPTAANILNQVCYENKNYLMAGMICAGWDERNGGVVYSIPLGGGLFRESYTIGGSGSGYIYGYCDANFRKGMSKHEAQEFVKNAISLAIWRDGSSGGVIRTVTITKDGVEREMVLGDKLPHLAKGWCP